MTIQNGKYLGTQVSEEFHKTVKLACTQKDMKLKEAIVKGLILVLELDETHKDEISAAIDEAVQ